MFFAGPTGVGKTESAKALSEFIFNDANQIIRFDMSEYNREESDQKLLGATSRLYRLWNRRDAY
ncbi:AAA family ATPase [Mycoplasmopsis cynos]|uniref:AAA family ATPase n=1 Tax=Mycoplasmopsis cynos TaxID=171284 RepID=UPI0024C93D59|nr:AAA family ATPase [Mycoplasmopsis cynos]WAM04108.1 AAA family ATPase [Mycoplasmopsis cynos]